MVYNNSNNTPGADGGGGLPSTAAANAAAGAAAAADFFDRGSRTPTRCRYPSQPPPVETPTCRGHGRGVAAATSTERMADLLDMYYKKGEELANVQFELDDDSAEAVPAGERHAPKWLASKNAAEEERDEELPEELRRPGEDGRDPLRGLDKELVNKIMNEIVDYGESVTFADIAGLDGTKLLIREMVVWPMQRPDLFTGLRSAPKGLLLFGPPGTGKTLIAKATAHESGATFFFISSSSMTSKWMGESEKSVRTLFAVAASREQSVVFIDGVDSLLTARNADEHEASRRIKTEFLVQMDGAHNSCQGRVMIIGATNRPHELDDAARRRFIKRVYIPLPEKADREILIRNLLREEVHSLSDEQITKLSYITEGYSGADIKALCSDAAMGPVLNLGGRFMDVAANDVPPIEYKHFRWAFKKMKPSVSQDDLGDCIRFNDMYGTRTEDSDDDDDDDDDLVPAQQGAGIAGVTATGAALARPLPPRLDALAQNFFQQQKRNARERQAETEIYARERQAMTEIYARECQEELAISAMFARVLSPGSTTAPGAVPGVARAPPHEADEGDDGDDGDDDRKVAPGEQPIT